MVYTPHPLPSLCFSVPLLFLYSCPLRLQLLFLLFFWLYSGSTSFPSAFRFPFPSLLSLSLTQTGVHGVYLPPPPIYPHSHSAFPVPSFHHFFKNSSFLLRLLPNSPSPPGSFPPFRLNPTSRPGLSSFLDSPPAPIHPLPFTISLLFLVPERLPPPLASLFLLHLPLPPRAAPLPPPTAGRPLWHPQGRAGRASPRAGDTRLPPTNKRPRDLCFARHEARVTFCQRRGPSARRSLQLLAHRDGATARDLEARHPSGGGKPSLPSSLVLVLSFLRSPSSPGPFPTPLAPHGLFSQLSRLPLPR